MTIFYDMIDFQARNYIKNHIKNNLFIGLATKPSLSLALLVLDTHHGFAMWVDQYMDGLAA
ncbi:MAG: hypothetical protein BECKG1743F_GA0114225_106451, partial [Candidatus Kentron sp. G]